MEHARLLSDFCSEEYEHAEICSQQVLKVLKERGLYAVYFDFLEMFYWGLRKSLQYDLALKILEEAWSVANELGMWEEQRRCALLLGQYYSRKPNYDSAFYYLKKYEWISELRQLEKSWKFYRLQAVIYQDLGDFSQAAVSFRKMYASGKREIQNRGQYGYMLYLVADFFYSLDSMDAFASFYNEYLLFLREGNPRFLEDPLHYGRLFIGDSLQVEKMEKAFDFHLKNDYPYGAFVMTTLLANLYNKNEEYAKSVALLESAEELFENVEFYTNKEDYYRLLMEAYKGLGKPEKALAVSEEFLAIQKENFNKEIADNISKWEVKYKTQQKENELLQKQLELDRSKLQKQRLGGFLLFLAMITIVIYGYARKKLLWERKLHRQEDLLKRQRIRELQAENRQLAMSKLIEGQEYERQHIARELHDGLGGFFTAIKAYLGAFEGGLTQPKDRKIYQKLTSILQYAGEELRRITHRMSPVALERTSLVESLSDLAYQLEKSGLCVSLELVALEQELPRELKVNLYRIIQELTTNIVKHAQAQNVLIQLVQMEDRLLLLVEDDGCGFDYHKAMQRATLGLQNIQARVQLLGGRMDVLSQMGEGTSVEIDIPRQAEQSGEDRFSAA